MAICIICEKEFIKSGTYQKCCKKAECINAQKLKNYKKYYEKNRKKIIKRASIRGKTPEAKLWRKKYREENKDKLRNSQKRSEAKNPEKYRRIKQKWDDKNREFLNEKSRKLNQTQERKDYKKKHAEIYKERRNKLTRQRLKNDIIFRLNANMSSHIKYDLKNNKINKNRRHWETFVPFTKEQLKTI